MMCRLAKHEFIIFTTGLPVDLFENRVICFLKIREKSLTKLFLNLSILIIGIVLNCFLKKFLNTSSEREIQ